MNKNELSIEHVGVTAFNPFSQHIGSSRAVMFNSHLNQKLVLIDPDEKTIQSGIEREFSKDTFKIEMPNDGTIIKIIERYPTGINIDSINYNPETVVIYEIEETKELDYFLIPNYMSYHQTFGYKLKFNENVNRIRQGETIKKGTIFADTPGAVDNNYRFGVNLNVALMTTPHVSEDGYVVSDAALKKFKFNLYETRVVNFGSKKFPLNIHGTIDDYKMFPDIGEYINTSRSDGVLMALRDYNEKNYPVSISNLDLMEIDHIFDKSVYVRSGNGKIIDIKVISNNFNSKKLPKQILTQPEKYRKAYVDFNKELYSVEQTIREERRKKYGEDIVKLTPKLHSLLVSSLSIINPKQANTNKFLNLVYRQVPLDEYRVEFIIEYEITPSIGCKLTDLNGGKGVICKIEKEENMPIDKDGNRADVIVDPMSTISRTNIGRLYEQYINGASRDVAKDIRKKLSIKQNECSTDILSFKDDKVNSSYNYLLDYYKIISDKQYQFYNTLSEEDKLEALTNVINNGICVYYPINNDIIIYRAILEIDKKFKPTFGPVSYIGASGIRCVTKNSIRIAPMYIMLLDKIADSWSSMSSGRLHHFGVLSPVIKSEKHATPYRNTAVKTIGEAEFNIVGGYCSPRAIAETIDRSNNPMSTKEMYRTILNSDTPGNIEQVIDRKKFIFGSNKPLLLMKHILMCCGINVAYKREDKHGR